VTLWVKKDAALIYKMAPAQQAAQQALAHYFAGALQAGAAAAQAQPLPRTPAAPCLPQTLPEALCPNTLPNALCPVSFAPPCGATHVATCHVTCAATCPAHATCGATCIATCAATCPAHATCGVTCAATCATCVTCAPHICTLPTHCLGVTCGIDCTVGGPCLTHPPHATCAPVCTHLTPCRPTFNQPECPFPTEICTHVPAQCTHLPNCPRPQEAQAGMGAEAQFGCVAGTVHASVQIACSVVCPTRHVTCSPECWVTRQWTCNPECRVTRYWTCNPECWPTRHFTCNVECYNTAARPC